ncbi:MAG: PD-(D/E)XK nuclease family protein [Phycisphaeraceae bacterium]
MPGNVNRIHLDWSRPALAAAAETLADRYAQPADRSLAMNHALIALPGNRAGRRLLELLLEQAESRDLRLIPPRIVTAGTLLDLLHTPPLPVADPIARRLAWSSALQQLDTDALATLVPQRPAADDAASGAVSGAVSGGQWDALAQLVEKLHADLASELLTFADVPDKALRTLPHFADHARWQSLAAAHRIYQQLLQRAGRIDPQDARLDAVAEHRCRCDHDLHLIALPEMTGQLRAMLAQLDTSITVFIHVPTPRQGESSIPGTSAALGFEGFDDFGSLLPDFWHTFPLPLRDDQIRIVVRPIDQAAAALQSLADLNAQYSADQITLGTPDPDVIPYLHQQLAAAGIPVRDAIGSPLPRTAPCRLLAVLASFLNEHRYSQFAALLRHPDITDYLASSFPKPQDAVSFPGAPLHGDHHVETFHAIADWSSLLDRYYNDHLQSRLTGDWLGGDAALRGRLASLWHHIHTNLLQPLAGSRPLSQWAQPILDILLLIFGRRELDRSHPADRLILESCSIITDQLSQLADLPASLDKPADAARAINLILSELADKAVPPEPLDPAVEMLGSLELHLDDAPVLIITGFNEGRFPQSVNADAFLPDTLRHALGLIDNDRRLARDLYQLAAILHSRPHVQIIAGRQSADADPLTPSRLLFTTLGPPASAGGESSIPGASAALGSSSSTSGGDLIAARILRFYHDDPSASIAPPSLHHPAPRSAFILPPQPILRRTQPFDYLRVTDFRAYLEDPYRFALARDLQLAAIDDSAAELDPGSFGSLAHRVLDQFGQSDIVHSTDIPIIQSWLTDALHDQVRRHFGHAPQPAIRIQAAQLQLRLLRFAEWHAHWIAAGWRVRHVELAFNEQRPAPLVVDDIPIALHGRIDRIDFHPDTGRWAILDYKTSDSGDDPEAVHRTPAKTNKQWLDLQLPLYRHLFRTLVPDAPVDDTTRVMLGYIRLPRAPGLTGAAFADWSPDELRDADLVARRIVREIREGRFTFDPLRKLRHPDFDPFADLCGSHQFIDDEDTPGSSDSPSKPRQSESSSAALGSSGVTNE